MTTIDTARRPTLPATVPGRKTRLTSCLAGAAAVLVSATPVLAQPTPVPEVAVTGSAIADLSTEGTTQNGYRPLTAETVGPRPAQPVQDAPYAISILSDDFLNNHIVSSQDDVFHLDPLVQPGVGSSRGYGAYIYLRGFQSNAFTLLDGLNLPDAFIMPMEDKERVEVLTGLSGFLYGPAHVGGVINYVLKRPTEAPLYAVTVGDYGGGQAFSHADLSGPIGSDGKFAYRLNLAASDGSTAVEDNHIEKYLGSLALDWHATSNLLLQANYAHQYYHETGTATDFGSFNGVIRHPDPDMFDPSKDYGQPWTYNTNVLDTAGLDATYRPADGLTLRASYAYTYVDEKQLYTGCNFVDQTHCSMNALAQAPQHHANQSGAAYVDYAFDTGPFSHTVTAGFYGNALEVTQPRDQSALLTIGTFLSRNFRLSCPNRSLPSGANPSSVPAAP